MSGKQEIEKISAGNAESMMIVVSGELLSLALSKVPEFEALIEQSRLEILEYQDDLEPKMETLINKVAEITVDTLRSANRPTIH